MAKKIAIPYSIHHGDLDNTVPLQSDIALSELLSKNGVANDMLVYNGYTHSMIAYDATVLSRIKSWYTNHGMFNTVTPMPTATPVVTVTPTKESFNPAGLTITGDPASLNGATWKYVSTDDGVYYEINGAIKKPTGKGPFPAVIASHGYGGDAISMIRNQSGFFVSWGCVMITCNYTHAKSPFEIGSPSNAPYDRGASFQNLQRAWKTYQVLASLSYVDTTRISAHGHSMGAFVTAALVGTHPGVFKVGTHTAGGVDDKRQPGTDKAFWTSSTQVKGIDCPYLMQHGDMDNVVPLSVDETMNVLLDGTTVHQLIVWPGMNHSIASYKQAFDEIKKWYGTYGML